MNVFEELMNSKPYAPVDQVEFARKRAEFDRLPEEEKERLLKEWQEGMKRDYKEVLKSL